ncbi:MAG: DUF58 domain-containing protein [Actinomycetota bacterium]
MSNAGSDGPAISLCALRRLEQLQLAASRRLVGAVAGEHRAPRHGSTLDFADFREYQPGDDVRRIDPHQLARLDVLRIKLFEGDEDLVVRVLLDTSESMTMHGKRRIATAVTAALGAVALTSGDSLSLVAFPAAPVPRRFIGRHGVPELVDALDRLPWGGSTPFARTVRQVLNRPGPPGMTVVVSDLLTTEWRTAVSRLPARRADLLVVHVGARREIEPELFGDLELEDSESGEQIPVSLTPEQLAGYRDRRRTWVAEVRRRCHEVGGRYLTVDAEDDVEQVLLRSWRTSGVLR